MSYILRWHNDQHTAIYRAMKPGWTWQDFDQSYLEAFGMIRTAKHPVDLVSDYREASQPPEGGGMLERFGAVWAQHPPNFGIFIIIGADEVQKTMGEIFTRTFGGNVEIARYVRTMEEAESILAERQPR